MSVIRQLALFEGRRQLKSPFFWLAVVASGALVWLAVHDEPATLWARSVTIAGSCLPIAIVTLFHGNTAAMRDHSSRVGETTDAPPTSRDTRMLGLVAGSWAGMAASLAVVGFGVVLSVTDEPAGSFLIPELAVGPLLVILGQAAGVALGRWIPNPLAAPLTLVVLAGLFLVQDLWPGARTIPAASPFLPWRRAYVLDWVQGEPRMPLLHLGYLLGLTGLITAWAARRWRVLAVAGVIVGGSALGLSGIETAGEEVGAEVARWADAQPRVCEHHEGVEYCAIEGYQPWIDDWARVVNRADELVPEELVVTEVQQVALSMEIFTDTNPNVAQVDGDLDDDRLTEQILAPEFGLPGTPGAAAKMNQDVPACMAQALPLFVSGEARAIAYLVLYQLAAAGTDEISGFGGTYHFGHLEISEDEANLAIEILQRPEDEILSVLHQHWGDVTDPATTSGELARWFGADPPQIATTSPYESMDCTCTGNGGVSCSSRHAP